MKKIYIALILISVISGCATTSVQPTGTTCATALLKRDTLRQIKVLENAFDLNGQDGISPFGSPKVVNYEQLKIPQTATDTGEEVWTIQRRGYVVKYKVTFIPTPDIGGVNIGISPMFKVTDYQ